MIAITPAQIFDRAMALHRQAFDYQAGGRSYDDFCTHLTELARLDDEPDLNDETTARQIWQTAAFARDAGMAKELAFPSITTLSGEGRREEVRSEILAHALKRVLTERDKLLDRVNMVEHLVVEAGIVPGIDPPCRCELCKRAAQGLANAGYLADVNDRWWES